MLCQALWAASLLAFVSLSPCAQAIPVSTESPADAKTPWQNFVSFSIEASSFPDFAGTLPSTPIVLSVADLVGNLSTPNDFSYNLLKNIREFAGIYPVIRVGGNTQYVVCIPLRIQT